MNEQFNSNALISLLKMKTSTVFLQYTYDNVSEQYYCIKVNNSLKLYSVSLVEFLTGRILFSCSNKKVWMQDDINNLSLDKSDDELFQEISILNHDEYITVLITKFICEYYEK